jgi:uncharacterized protein (TIGR03083 family)
MKAATAAQRRDLADWLLQLDEASLNTPSLCSGWTVKAVAGHLAAAVTTGIPGFLVKSVRHGGFHRATDADARSFATRPTADIAATLRSHADRRVSNPGVGAAGPLTDVLVHTGDMRLPLGLPHDPQPERTKEALTFLTSGKAFGFVRRGTLDGLAVSADDSDFSAGTGDALHGRGVDLMMALCGRTAVLDRLTGPGVERLRANLT